MSPPNPEKRRREGGADRGHADGEQNVVQDTGTFEADGSTGDQIGGQSHYAEDEVSGRRQGLPKR
jgi:hypothetical protein